MAYYNIKVAVEDENMTVIVFTRYDEILMLVEEALMLEYISSVKMRY